MGIFDFVASAGEKLADALASDDAGADINEKVEVSQERLDTLRKENITRSVAALDIDGEQVNVSVKGDVATLAGTAPSQEALEKLVLCAGNQHGIASVDCQLSVDTTDEGGDSESAVAATESSFYTVQSGDTLGKIAENLYGSASKYTVIFEANRPMLSDPNKIYPGQSLRIPAL